MSQKDPNCFSVLTRLNKKTLINFVNKTIKTLPSLCLKRFAPKDNINIKRKRGRLRKHCIKLSEGRRSPAPKGKPSAKIKRRRLPKYSNKPSPVLPLIVQGKLKIKRTKEKLRRRYSTLFTGLSYCLASSQSHNMLYLESEDKLEISNNESESESDYKLIKSSGPYLLQEGYWVSSKRRRKGNYLVTSSSAAASTPQVVIYV